MSNIVNITRFGWLEPGKSRTVIVEWTWDWGDTKGFDLVWRYKVPNKDREKYGADTEFIGQRVTVNEWDKSGGKWNCTYDVPENAWWINVGIQPKSNTKQVNGNTVDIWTADWVFHQFNVGGTAAPNPPEPISYEINEEIPNQFTINWTGIFSDEQNKYVTHIDLQTIRLNSRGNDSSSNTDYGEIVKTERYPVNKQFGTCTVVDSVEPGHTYVLRARYRVYNDSDEAFSDWSEVAESSKIYPAPKKPEITGIELRKGSNSQMALVVSFAVDPYITRRELQLATTRHQFRMADEIDAMHYTSEQYKQRLNEIGVWVETGLTIKGGSYEVTNYVTSGVVYARTRTFDEDKAIKRESVWSDIYELANIGELLAPTAWMPKNYAYVGDETIRLCWMHNSPAGTHTDHANLIYALYGDLDNRQIKLVPHKTDGNAYTPVYEYDFDITEFSDKACFVEWFVQTFDVNNETGSDRSEYQRFYIYNKPELNIKMVGVSEWNSVDGNNNYEDVLVSTFLPIDFDVTAFVGAEEKVTSYEIQIFADESYEIQDVDGKMKMVNKGDIIFSTFITEDLSTEFSYSIGPDVARFDNSRHYILKVDATISSGATATASVNFLTRYEITNSVFKTSFSYDENRMSMSINAYVVNNYETDTLKPKTRISVYRVHDDGTVVAIAENFVNSKDAYVTDPHPMLKNAQYRIVATDMSNGHVEYYDPPAYPVKSPYAVLQWDESYRISFDNPDESSVPTVNGTMLKLLYDIDVTENTSIESNLINYIGRKNPVSYYGTQTGYTASWSADILKSDIDTIKLLRKLQVYMGNVYVREPSGTGYWAKVNVTFPLTHCEQVVPVSLSMTRVEGGI